ncbi:MAG: hypothetical protein JRJ51_04990 [Deltaproteobacteria bacterium]|nr:hypothetical protein [Deltaproteobacteria bacterium]MBW1942175.1 hypothetical protein [Deltaproteobacteria bacterium]
MAATFRKSNHRAIAGFLLPFMAAGLACALVLWSKGDIFSSFSWVFFVTLIPLTLCAGLIFSITSVSHVEARGDRDYAYSGLVLNLLFILLYILSLFYYYMISSP